MHTRFLINSTHLYLEPLDDDLYCISSVSTTDLRERCRGQASRALTMACEEADAEGVTLFLDVVPSRGTDRVRLESLYRRHGFVLGTEMYDEEWRVFRPRIGPCYRDSIMVRRSMASPDAPRRPTSRQRGRAR